jgi:hypothetical protein
MNTYRHLLILNREWLMKNFCERSTRPEAVLAVGLRQKALPKCFLLATTASRVFQQPISAHQWS